MFKVVDCLGAIEFYSNIVLAGAEAYKLALETRSFSKLFDKTGKLIARFRYHFSDYTDMVNVIYF